MRSGGADGVADRVLAVVRDHPSGLSTREIEVILGRGAGDEAVRWAIRDLRRRGLIRRKTRGPDNRIRWTDR